jgi:hypothetical protein
MSFTSVPFDFTKLTTAQQDSMFIAWCEQVMDEIAALGHRALLLFEPKGDVGMATEKVIQGAFVWIDELKVQVRIAFNDMLDSDAPNQDHPERKRNFPDVKAAVIVEEAQEWAVNPPPADTYGIVARPATGDISVAPEA